MDKPVSHHEAEGAREEAFQAGHISRTLEEEENCLFFDHATDLLCIVWLDGRFKRVSPSFGAVLGWDPEELVEKPLTDIIHPDDREETARKAEARVTGMGAVSFENRCLCKDGTCRWVSWNCHPLADKEIFLCIGRDVTGAKRMEEELRSSREKLDQDVRERTKDIEKTNVMLREEIERRKKAEHEIKTLADNAPDIILRFDAKARHTYISPAYERIYGIQRRGLIGKTVREIGLPNELANVLSENIDYVFRTGLPLYHEFDRPAPTGVKHILAYVAPEFDAEGRVESALVISRDMSEKHHLEKMLREGQKLEAVGTLAGGIAHDFNNILAVIIGNAELAMEDLEDGSGPKHSVEQVFKAAKRARDLVKQILTFSRSGKEGRKAIQLTPLVRETFEMLRSSLPTTIEMSLQVASRTDAVLADPAQMQQVLMNLVTNAAHAIGEGGGKIAVELGNGTVGKGQHATHHVRLTVADTGIGMDDEVKSHIFEPFFTTKEPGQGTGMGLAVVYGIVKSHGGTIEVESEEGHGSRFTVLIPAVRAFARKEEAADGVVPHGKGHILFVDDEPSLAEISRTMLERLGYRVTVATESVEAWKLFVKDPYLFDLVITDYTMPSMTGTVLARKMIETRADIPIILCTGYSEAASAEKARQMGISQFIMKPLTRREVAETIRKVLDGRVGV